MCILLTNSLVREVNLSPPPIAVWGVTPSGIPPQCDQLPQSPGGQYQPAPPWGHPRGPLGPYRPQAKVLALVPHCPAGPVPVCHSTHALTAAQRPRAVGIGIAVVGGMTNTDQTEKDRLLRETIEAALLAARQWWGPKVTNEQIAWGVAQSIKGAFILRKRYPK